MRLRCPPQNRDCVLTAGDPTASSPPFPLVPTICGAVRRCRRPTRLHGLRPRVADLSCIRRGPENCAGPACCRLDLELRQGLDLHLPCCARRPVSTAVTERAAEWSGPCLTLGLFRQRLSPISRQLWQHYPAPPRMSSLWRPDFLGARRGLPVAGGDRRPGWRPPPATAPRAPSSRRPGRRPAPGPGGAGGRNGSVTTPSLAAPDPKDCPTEIER